MQTWEEPQPAHLGNSLLLPWVSHLVQHTTQGDFGKALFTTQQIKSEGRVQGLQDLVWGYFVGLKK